MIVISARDLGKVMTQRCLLTKAWGPTHVEDSQYLRAYVGQLRAKLGEAAWLLRTEPGVGPGTGCWTKPGEALRSARVAGPGNGVVADHHARRAFASAAAGFPAAQPQGPGGAVSANGRNMLTEAYHASSPGWSGRHGSSAKRKSR